MEYLEMNGTVKLDQSKNSVELPALIGQLQTIDFVDEGEVNIELEDDTLSVAIEGPVMETRSLKDLLKKLSGYLTPNSYIQINYDRWETKVIFSYINITKPLKLMLVD